MKSLFYIILLTISALNLNAQIIISNDENYQNISDAELIIDGSLTIRDRIFTGGNETTLGNPGKAGQVLVSQGANLPPRWRTLNIPNIEENAYYLIYNNSFQDQVGIDINNDANTNNGNGPYPFDTPRSNSRFNLFQTIQGLNQEFVVHSTNNEVYITFEAVAHTNLSSNDSGADFVCGIFAGGSTNATKRLKGIRKLTIQQSYGAGQSAFITYTQTALASDLGVGTHNVEVACKRTATYGTLSQLSIGKKVPDPSVSNINNFVAQSSLKVEVYEIPNMNNGTSVIDFNP